ncbi:undecaprenyl-diphosphate phosphatase [bacterium]|nr:undecaprenyl-diphosphate phosphatase [bacterium]
MTLLHSVILGIVQGLGEFLPISSSGHLVVTPWLLNFDDPGLSFDVALHFGTLIAIVAYFWKDWVELFRGFFISFTANGKTERNILTRNLFLYLVAASVPGALVGLALDDIIEANFRAPLLVAGAMAIMGVILWAVDAKSSSNKNLGDIRLKEALLIGISQALALFPGVSRSGITMTTARLLKVDRVSAARFSFLLATPITFGACVLKFDDFIKGGVGVNEIVGILVSGIIGFLSIKYLLQFVRTYTFQIFAYYRFVFALLVLVVYLLRA